MQRIIDLEHLIVTARDRKILNNLREIVRLRQPTALYLYNRDFIKFTNLAIYKYTLTRTNFQLSVNNIIIREVNKNEI